MFTMIAGRSFCFGHSLCFDQVYSVPAFLRGVLLGRGDQMVDGLTTPRVLLAVYIHINL